MGHEFPSETFLPENGTNFSDIPLLPPGNFPLKRPKKSCYFYFLTDISGSSLSIVNVFFARVLQKTCFGTTDLWKNLWWPSSQDNFFLLLIFSTRMEKSALYTKILKVRFEKLLPLVRKPEWSKVFENRCLCKRRFRTTLSNVFCQNASLNTGWQHTVLSLNELLCFLLNVTTCQCGAVVDTDVYFRTCK